jgi:hypothetical protein
MRRRDSFFNENVLWTGEPKLVETPLVYRLGSIVAGVVALISTLSAIAVATALRQPIGGMLLFSAWMVTVAVALRQIPRWWRSQLEYVLTEQSIIVRRGKFRRSIDRASVSFARIHWSPHHPGIGDLELVRAVPTGALRRRLTLSLPGLVAPDRVWAIVRGITPSTPTGDGHRLLAQRLDEGERVVWSSHPQSRWRRWVPAGWRTTCTLAIGFTMALTSITTAVRASAVLKNAAHHGLVTASVPFVTLVASIGLTIALLAVAAGAILYGALFRPARLERETRYLITDRRVLIQRGDEELHLDRGRIVDVIDTKTEGGRSDLFLVLDGPAARALAPSGAFGNEPDRGLQPVLQLVEDPDAVCKLILEPPHVTDLAGHPDPSLPEAA